nr:transposase [Halanaerobium hydrogeniformans]
MGKRRTYTEEFKRDAVELSLNSDKSVKEIAEDLGINYGNLNRWRREYRNNRKLKNEKLKLEIAKIYWQHGAAMEAPEYTNSW